MKTKYDIKVNSVYIEFDPIEKITWSMFRENIMHSMSEHDINVVTWETGTTIATLTNPNIENK